MKETTKKIIRGSITALLMLGCVVFCTAETGGCGGGGNSPEKAEECSGGGGSPEKTEKSYPTKRGGGGKPQPYDPENGHYR